MAVSIVMPVYNEEAVVEQVIKQHYAQIVERIPGSDFIVVNDGSTDTTPEILERLGKELPELRVINRAQNGGYGSALCVGLAQAENPFIFHIDSDNQFTAEDFWRLYPFTESHDIIIGFRSPRGDRVYRRVMSICLRFINVVLLGIWIKDINSPFKLMRTSVVRAVRGKIPPDSFAPSIPILLIAQHEGYRIIEVPVVHHARKTGRSIICGRRLFKGCVSTVRDIFKLKHKFLR
ncbi:glycosyltransferase family 2 protein [Candidatus Omnitrophota bacterium]